MVLAAGFLLLALAVCILFWAVSFESWFIEVHFTPGFFGSGEERKLWRFLSLLVASNEPGCGEMHFTFLLTGFRMWSARAFMGELYTRFLGAGGWNRKGGESMLLLALLLSLNFLEFPLVSLQFLNDFCLTGFWKLKRRHPRNTLKTRKVTANLERPRP